MKTCAIIQARSTSKRFPKKVLASIKEEMNAIDLVYLRAMKAKLIDQVIFACPERDEDLIKYLNSKGYKYCVGSENDVLTRYLIAAKYCKADAIVRITADCPLVDGTIIDKCVSYIEDYEYISNNTPPEESEYANGSDVEVFTMKLLTTVGNKFLEEKDREHVTFPMWDGRLNTNRYRLSNKRNDKGIRITLDYHEDLSVLKTILKEADPLNITYDETVECYRRMNLDQINGFHHYAEGW